MRKRNENIIYEWIIYIFQGTFPIDTTKTRLQVQGQILDGQFNKIKYRGMIDAFCQIYRHEGFLSLYSGYKFIKFLF